MHIQTDRALIPAATPSVRYLQVRISAPSAPATAGTPRPPAEVALVLDRSGSMGGSKLEMARTAVQHAIRLLAPTDHLAVVCYDDRVDTLLGRTPASKEAKALALERLAVTDARGSTDLAGGWLAGAAQLRAGAGGVPEGPAEAGAPGASAAADRPARQGDASADPAPHVKRVLLLTDGLANRGLVEPSELAAAAEALRAQGITTSTFGLGADFDEALLSRLASAGGGHFYFIEQAVQIPDVFMSELGEALDVVARDAVFEITCTPGAEATLVNDLPTEAIAGGIRVRLGDLVADQELSFVVAVHITTPPAPGAGVEAKCRLRDRGGVLFDQPLFVDWAVVSLDDDLAQLVNLDVVRAFAAALVARGQASALAHNRRGAFDEARRVMGEAIEMLRRLAPDDAVIGALVAQLAREREEFAHALPALEMKRRHFVSYSISNSRDIDGQARRRPDAS